MLNHYIQAHQQSLCEAPEQRSPGPGQAPSSGLSKARPGGGLGADVYTQVHIVIDR